MKRKTILALLILLLSGIAGAIDVGDKAPEFSLRDLDSTLWTLSKMRGKVVLVVFFGYN